MMDVEGAHARSTLTSQWVWAHTLGFALGGAAGSLVGFPTGFAVGMVVGGAASAILQWLVLRRHVVWAAWWGVASMVGLAVGVAVSLAGGLFARMATGLAIFINVNLLLSFAVFGISLGTLQWFILRRRCSYAGWWLVASLVGWVVGMPLGRVVGLSVGFPAAMVASIVVGGEVGGQVGFVVTMLAGLAAAGAVLGAVTGRTLLWLLRQPGADV